jgi:hypothetical protein
MQVAVGDRMSAPLKWPGYDFVHTEVVSLGEDGPYRLTVVHARGSIVEYFPDTPSALNRQGELADLITAACGASRPRHRAV